MHVVEVLNSSIPEVKYRGTTNIGENYDFETDCFMIKSLIAAVSGSENPSGPW